MTTNETQKESPTRYTFGAYLLCLMAMGVSTAFTSLFAGAAAGIGGYYTVGGILSWILAIPCAFRYKSDGKLGQAVGIAFAIGIGIGLLAVAVAPTLYAMRYGG